MKTGIGRVSAVAPLVKAKKLLYTNGVHIPFCYFQEGKQACHPVNQFGKKVTQAYNSE